MCCLAGPQPVRVDSGSCSCGPAAAGASSMSLLVTEGTAAGAPCLRWACLALWEERSIVRRTFLVRDLTRPNMGEGGKCLTTRLRFSTAPVTEAHTFTPRLTFVSFREVNSATKQEGFYFFSITNHSESIGLGEPGVTLAPQSTGPGRPC